MKRDAERGPSGECAARTFEVQPVNIYMSGVKGIVDLSTDLGWNSTEPLRRVRGLVAVLMRM